MTTDEKLAAILAAVQTDPGNRGLARDPHDNLFTATAGDFQAACGSIEFQRTPALDVDTGFFIPTATPAAYETDGPLGAVFLARALASVVHQVGVWVPPGCANAVEVGFRRAGLSPHRFTVERDCGSLVVIQTGGWPGYMATHSIALECVGPAGDGRYYSMRGRDLTDCSYPFDGNYKNRPSDGPVTIGIGDGGNEVGMGKVPHETIVKNIPNGDLVHCRVPTDHLIVAGVSNWGAYALAAGVYVLRGIRPPADLFDPDRER
ncbi:MAG: DUF4392 domain-containing protein, partial [Rhodospirillales bacterium]|nr:DUF4392 domain-containing protein [Rhodospirillales bacterium]